MKHRRLKTFFAAAFLSAPCFLWAQTAGDSTITVGYATVSSKSFAGIANKIDESQMNNKDQVTNAIDAIQGRVAGMTVEKNGLNAMNAVRLRGTTSLTGGNDPLIIVDGVMGDLSLLESVYPTDIESFTIMKDASETSQYGSRGAAGVIEITTRKGSPGKLRVNYNGSFGLSQIYKRYDMLSAADYRSYCADNGIGILDKGSATNFQKAIDRTGFKQQHHLAFLGGTDKSNYRVSVGYTNNQKVIRNMYDHTFMSNMNMSQEMFDGFLKIDLGLFGNTSKERSPFDVQKLLYSAATWNPTFSRNRNASGEYDGYASASQINNPLALLEEKNVDESQHISTHAKLTFNLTEELKFILFGAYTYTNSENSQYIPYTVWNKAQAYKGQDKHQSLLGNAMLTYGHRFGRHGLNLLALSEVQEDHYDGFHVTVTNFQSNQQGYDDLSAGALRPWGGTGSYDERPRMVSFMGRANYAYDDRYIFTFTARTDGSSKFGANNRWGFFPSVSGAWVISKEPFMQRQDFFDDLKLNVGYGLSGNQDGIDSYTTLALLKPNGLVAAGNGNLVSFSELKNVNPDLKWEVSKTFNVGIDAKMLDGRLIFGANFYSTKVTDMLYPYSVSVPPFTYNTLVANLGSMRNRGLEISLGGTPLISRDMELNINANLTFQSNKLLSLSGYYQGEYLHAATFQPVASLNGAGFHGNNDITYQIVGHSIGSFYVPHCTGLVSDGKGGYKYQLADLNGDGKADASTDRYIAGQAMPKVLMGSNISFRYKDFDVSMQVNGAFGHKIFNGTSLAYMNTTSLPLYNILSDAPAKGIADQEVSDYWLERGDYVNIDYITVGWRVPLKQHRYVESLRLSLTMNNVATFTGYSGLTPMVNSYNLSGTLGIDDKTSYPLYHTYTLGLSISF